MNQLTFELITPAGIKFHEDAYEVILPTPNGEVGILPNHVPLVSLVVPGVIIVRRHERDNQLESFATSGGLVEIVDNHVELLADTAEHASEIDVLRAQEAIERAQELQKTAQDHVTLADATRLIERNLVRLKVSDIKKHHRR